MEWGANAVLPSLRSSILRCTPNNVNGGVMAMFCEHHPDKTCDKLCGVAVTPEQICIHCGIILPCILGVGTVNYKCSCGNIIQLDLHDTDNIFQLGIQQGSPS